MIDSIIEQKVNKKVDERLSYLFSVSFKWAIVIVAIFVLGYMIYNLGYVNAISDNKLEYAKQAKLEFYTNYNNFINEARKIVGIEVPQ
jgi:hypothetical protein